MTDKFFRATVLILTWVAAGTVFFPGSAAAKWENLFDGKTLQGWETKNGWAEFRVEDGAIVGKSVARSPNTFLATKKVYGDFILELEVKVDEGLNSGVQFRSSSFPEYREGRVHGYQYELDTGPRAWTAGIYDEARRGWLYPVDFNPRAKTLFKQNEWNQVKIECAGPSLRTWLNGKPVAHLIDDLTSKGFIALQVHGVGGKEDLVGKEIAWRNIRINTAVAKPTPSRGFYIRNLIPNSVSPDEAARGWKLLWNGKNLDGWRNVGKNSAPEEGWMVEDGVLTVQASKPEQKKIGGDIIAEDPYGAFELDLEFKISPGANSGIKYFATEKGQSALGLEYQILDDKRHPDAKKGVVGNRTCASLYDLIPSERFVSHRRVPVEVGKWNHARIIVRPNGMVQHWLNGFKVVQYQRGNSIFHALVARSKYAGLEGFGLADKGYISLQDHRDEVSFRSIKIRQL